MNEIDLTQIEIKKECIIKVSDNEGGILEYKVKPEDVTYWIKEYRNYLEKYCGEPLEKYCGDPGYKFYAYMEFRILNVEKVGGLNENG